MISLNYDLIADNTFSAAAEDAGRARPPGLRGGHRDRRLPGAAKVGKLLKLHGSLNWLYCPNCHRLELGIARERRPNLEGARAAVPHGGVVDLATSTRPTGHAVPDCGTGFQAVSITPTHLKDYRNPHIARTW